MPRNVYCEINLHFVWHTKDNQPVLEGSIEKHLFSFLRERVLQTQYERAPLLCGSLELFEDSKLTKEETPWMGAGQGVDDIKDLPAAGELIVRLWPRASTPRSPSQG